MRGKWCYRKQYQRIEASMKIGISKRLLCPIQPSTPYIWENVSNKALSILSLKFVITYIRDATVCSSAIHTQRSVAQSGQYAVTNGHLGRNNSGIQLRPPCNLFLSDRTWIFLFYQSQAERWCCWKSPNTRPCRRRYNADNDIRPLDNFRWLSNSSFQVILCAWPRQMLEQMRPVLPQSRLPVIFSQRLLELMDPRINEDLGIVRYWRRARCETWAPYFSQAQRATSIVFPALQLRSPFQNLFLLSFRNLSWLQVVV